MNANPSVVIHFNLFQGYLYVSKLPPSVCFLLLSTLARVTEDKEFLQDQLRWIEANGDRVATALALNKEEVQALSLNGKLDSSPIHTLKGNHKSHGNHRTQEG